MIPTILHQTWKTAEVPKQWRHAVDSWKHHHPDWDYRLWTNADGYEFVAQHYPDLYPAYCEYPYDIQRADVIRYLVLHHYGGLYADMDYECLQPFDGLLKGRVFVAGCEPPEHHDIETAEEVICNALLAAEPGSPFLGRVIDALLHQQLETVSMRDVLLTTGPLLLQRVLERYTGPDIDILPSRMLCPLSYRSKALRILAENSSRAGEVRQFLVEQGVYSVHYWANSWMKNISATPLVNPDPDGLPGFTFYPGQDSVGYDLFNGGRNIPELAKRCLDDGRVVAFNTDGFAKHTLLAPEQWSTMRDSNDPNQGLYVKNTLP